MRLTNSRGCGCAPCIAERGSGSRKRLTLAVVAGSPERVLRGTACRSLPSQAPATRRQHLLPGKRAARGTQPCCPEAGTPVSLTLLGLSCLPASVGSKRQGSDSSGETRACGWQFLVSCGWAGVAQEAPQARSQQNSVLPRGGEVTVTPEPQLCNWAVRREVRQELKALPPSFCPWSQGPASRLPVHTLPGALLSVGPHAARPGLGASNSSFS